MTNKEIVNKMMVIKDKQAKLKEEYESLATELQKRAVQELEDHNTKCIRYGTAKGSVTVVEKASLDLVSALALKRVIGAELFSEEVTEEKSVKYKLKNSFENTLKAIVTKDYDFALSREDVYNSLNASPEERKVLDKKLKGDYAKDYDTLVALYGERDFDTELYCIYKLVNAERIQVFFPDCDEAFLDKIRKCLAVTESISVTTIKN